MAAHYDWDTMVDLSQWLQSANQVLLVRYSAPKLLRVMLWCPSRMVWLLTGLSHPSAYLLGVAYASDSIGNGPTAALLKHIEAISNVGSSAVKSVLTRVRCNVGLNNRSFLDLYTLDLESPRNR